MLEGDDFGGDTDVQVSRFSQCQLTSKRVLVVFGAFPEAIKVALVVMPLCRATEVEAFTRGSAQHRQMPGPEFAWFHIEPDFGLDLMRPNETPATLMSAVLDGIGRVLDAVTPVLVLVHSDHMTTFATALVCFYRPISLGYIAAGLCAEHLQIPWSEEMNRHFFGRPPAPDNLMRQQVACESIWAAGNTMINTRGLWR